MSAATTTTPHVLSLAELDALPALSPIRYTELYGRPALAIKRDDGTNGWNTTDGPRPDSTYLSYREPVLLVPAGGAS